MPILVDDDLRWRPKGLLKVCVGFSLFSFRFFFAFFSLVVFLPVINSVANLFIFVVETVMYYIFLFFCRYSFTRSIGRKKTVNPNVAHIAPLSRGQGQKI